MAVWWHGLAVVLLLWITLISGLWNRVSGLSRQEKEVYRWAGHCISWYLPLPLPLSPSLSLSPSFSPSLSPSPSSVLHRIFFFAGRKSVRCFFMPTTPTWYVVHTSHGGSAEQLIQMVMDLIGQFRFISVGYECCPGCFSRTMPTPLMNSCHWRARVGWEG